LVKVTDELISLDEISIASLEKTSFMETSMNKTLNEGQAKAAEHLVP
jgi:hypothetical protein